MTKHQAQDALDEIIAKKTGGSTQPRPDERIVTLGWFTRNRFFPLKEGSSWREGTASNRKSAIERDILAELGETPMEQIDKVRLQQHLNQLARKRSSGRVMHARVYLNAIFEEALDQELVSRNPARKLVLPNELRAVDKTTLSWDQLRLVLASASIRDRVLLLLEMTETFRPSELLALRWKSFDVAACTLTVSETAYRGRLRSYGKTRKSLRTVHLPEGVADELVRWKRICRDSAEEAFIFPSARRRYGAERKGPIRTDNYRARVLQPLAEKLGLPKLNFQVLRRTMATLAQSKGGVKDIQAILGHSKPDITAACYMQPIAESVKQTQEAIYQELMAPQNEMGGVRKTENLVRFGTVGVCGRPQLIESERLGA